MKGNLKIVFKDGTRYRVPLSVIITDLVMDEMEEKKVPYEIAKENVEGYITKNPHLLVNHASRMDYSDIDTHLKLEGCIPTRIKKKFAWREAKKEVVYE